MGELTGFQGDLTRSGGVPRTRYIHAGAVLRRRGQGARRPIIVIDMGIWQTDLPWEALRGNDLIYFHGVFIICLQHREGEGCWRNVC